MNITMPVYILPSASLSSGAGISGPNSITPGRFYIKFSEHPHQMYCVFLYSFNFSEFCHLSIVYVSDTVELISAVLRTATMIFTL